MIDPAHWLVQRSIKREECLVADPVRGMRSMFARTAFWFGVALGASIGRAFLPTTSIAYTVLSVVVGWFAGIGGLSMAARASAYRRGWLNGRQSFVESMSEAQQRGMSMREWLEREYERDTVVAFGEIGSLNIEPD